MTTCHIIYLVVIRQNINEVMKMKKLIALLLVIVIVFSFAGCSNTTDIESHQNDYENYETEQNSSEENEEVAQETHVHSYSNATCTEAAKCSCGATKGSALGHNYSGKYCSRCGANNPNYTEKEKHTHYYTSQVTREATCGQEGIRTYKCSCGHSYTESISKKSYHNWEYATCTTPKKCKDCGVTEGEAKAHSYSALYNYKCDMCGQVDPIVDGALKNSSLKTPKLPLTVTCYDAISECKFNITNIEYEFEYYSNGKVLLKAKFSGVKVYDSKGDSHSSTCEITWKLYDSNGNVVNSGFQYTPSLTTGEKISNIEETLLPHYKASEPGMYRLEILPTNR